jgi:membrane protease subunit HflC
MGEVEHIRQKRKGPKIALGFLGVILIAVIFLGAMSVVITGEDEYTLVKQFGKVERVISEAGLSFKAPFVEDTATLPKKIMIYDLAKSDVITKDKKTMVADSYVLWKISDPLKFTQTLNSNIANAESRINTTVYNSLKNVIGTMEQSEVISGRDGELNAAIMKSIGTIMDQYGITLIVVETKQLDLPSDNKTAVYERMISERNNIAASYTAEGEAEAKKIRTSTDNEIAVSVSKAQSEAEKTIAEGEAEYMKILASAYADQSRSDFYTYVRALDAAKSMLSGTNKTLILNSDSPIAQIFNTVE